MKLKLLLIIVSITLLLWLLVIPAFAQEKPSSPGNVLKTPFSLVGASVQAVNEGLYQQAESSLPLECLDCHTRVLKEHDILGSGNNACWVCHDSSDMYKLRLADNTPISPVNSPQVCAQCHQNRYEAWKEGLHGILSDAGRMKCIDCHDPHQPQLTFEDIVKPGKLLEGSDASLDCVKCHARVLKGHDKLGTGSEACWACHNSNEMTSLHLAGGETRLPLSDYVQLCAQCHQKRYEAWNDGTHGVPGWKEGEPGIPASEKAKCLNCHEPHQPQVVLLDITKPHPQPASPPPEAPLEPFIMLGIALLLIIGAGFIVRTGGGQA